MAPPHKHGLLMETKPWFLWGMPTVAQMVKRLPAMRETWVRSLGWEDPLEKEMATHSSTLAWKIPWTEKPCRLQSMGSQRVRHDWATSLHFTSWFLCTVLKDLPDRKKEGGKLRFEKKQLSSAWSPRTKSVFEILWKLTLPLATLYTCRMMAEFNRD